MAAQSLESRTGMGQQMRAVQSGIGLSDRERAAEGQLASSAQQAVLRELEVRGELSLNLI